MTEFYETTTYLVGAGVGVFFIVAFVLFKSFFKIEQGHLGVITTFGAAQFENEELRRLKTLEPGLHVKWPWQKFREFSMMERSADLTSHTGAFLAITEDGTTLKLESKLRIQPVRENLYAYLFEMRDPVNHIQEIFKCQLRHEVANIKGSYDTIRKQRHQLNQRLAKISEEYIGTRYGIQFNAVDITDILPPEELARALNAVQNAQADAETGYSRAEAESDRSITSAKQAVEIASNRAMAAETEITTLGDILKGLKDEGVLEAYLKRRQDEVYTASKMSFVQRNKEIVQ